jgi:protoporphyrinogen oxidase
MNGKIQRAVIIGAGPAGLTAAYELLTRTNIKPIILERSERMGGLSQTVPYKGNRIDIGGHRFFSKSDRVMDWWLKRLPLEPNGCGAQQIKYHGMSRDIQVNSAGTEPSRNGAERVMLLRPRKSRIYFLRKFFDYPISLTKDTLLKLGAVRVLRFGFSYLRTVLFPVKNIQNLEQFFISRFGRELYRTFFKSYTEKVWGVPCHEISSTWGEQRIKGLSIKRALLHFLKTKFRRSPDLAQKTTETSLIERFLYPKYGPGQMWETVAQEITRLGGEIVTNCDIDAIHCQGDFVVSVRATSKQDGPGEFAGEYFFSTMAVKDLVRAMDAPIPANVRDVSEGLLYRDFITVGILVKKLKVAEKNKQLIDDNWIYIQEPDVLVGRLQIFNNWSPYMVADQDSVWIGAEYFCYESDELWKKPDSDIAALACNELDKIGILDKQDVLDSVVIRMPKTYPAYFGTYGRFDEIRKFVDDFPNLFLVGRNGMHRYNNQDHSMLTAMLAVDNIIAGRTDKANLWEVNTEMDYHEEVKQEEKSTSSAVVEAAHQQI